MRYSAYHGDAGFKQTVVRLLTHLSEVGLISRGTVNDEGVGAAVFMVMNHRLWRDDPIKDFCEMLGFPEWIGQLYNFVYERLPEGVGNEWAVEFMQAIPVGCDLDELKLPLYRGLLADKEIGVRSACGSDGRVGAIIDDLLEGLVRCRDPEDLRALYSRLEQECEKATRMTDVFADKELRPTCALFCADWIMVDLPTSAVLMAVSARVGCLSRIAAWWHIRRHGQEGLVAAVTTLLGGEGFALRSDRETQYRRVAEFLVKEVSHIRSSAVATASAEEIERHRSALREVLWTGEDPAGEYDPYQRINHPSIPNEQSRIWRHWAMRVTGLLARYLGWVMLMLGYSAILTVFSSVILRIMHVEWLPYQVGAFLLLSLGGTCMVNWGRRLSRGDGWYKVLRHPDRLVLYLRMFEDDRRRMHPRLTRWFVPRLSIEEEVVEALEVLGEVVQIGDPHDWPMDRAGSRIYLKKHEDWLSIVSWLMLRAQITVLMFGYNEGIRTEMRRARQLLPPERVLLHIPYHRWREWVDFVVGNVRTTEASLAFDDALQQILSADIRLVSKADLKERPSFLWFHSGWRVQALRPYDSERLRETWRRSRGRLYHEALRPVYRRFGVTLRRNFGWRLLFGCLICAPVIAVFFLLVGSLGMPLFWQVVGSIPVLGLVYSRVRANRNLDYSEVDRARFLG